MMWVARQLPHFFMPTPKLRANPGKIRDALTVIGALASKRHEARIWQQIARIVVEVQKLER